MNKKNGHLDVYADNVVGTPAQVLARDVDQCVSGGGSALGREEEDLGVETDVLWVVGHERVFTLRRDGAEALRRRLTEPTIVLLVHV